MRVQTTGRRLYTGRQRGTMPRWLLHSSMQERTSKLGHHGALHRLTGRRRWGAPPWLTSCSPGGATGLTLITAASLGKLSYLRRFIVAVHDSVPVLAPQ